MSLSELRHAALTMQAMSDDPVALVFNPHEALPAPIRALAIELGHELREEQEVMPGDDQLEYLCNDARGAQQDGGPKRFASAATRNPSCLRRRTACFLPPAQPPARRARLGAVRGADREGAGELDTGEPVMGSPTAWPGHGCGLLTRSGAHKCPWTIRHETFGALTGLHV